MKEKRICFYDSSGGSGKEHLLNIKRYIADEHKSEKKEELDMTVWELRYVICLSRIAL